MSSETIQSITFAATMPGPRLLVLGGVHGHETCGPRAIRRVLDALDGGDIPLRRGRVTFVPVCNPRAAALDRRFTESNLNRRLVPKTDPQTYEDRLGNILCPLLADCDVLLDLHSYTVGGDAFTFVGPENPAERAYAASLGPRTLVTGFGAAYAATGRNPATDPDESVGTTEYSRRFGAIAVTLECGQHRDPDSTEIGYRAILNALGHLGMADTGQPTGATARLVTVERVYYRDHDGAFSRPWKNLEAVEANEIIATQADGTIYRATSPGVIVLPHADTPIGQEWFYFGIEAAV